MRSAFRARHVTKETHRNIFRGRRFVLRRRCVTLLLTRIKISRSGALSKMPIGFGEAFADAIHILAPHEILLSVDHLRHRAQLLTVVIAADSELRP
jgi:hypothetical protein